MSVGEEPQSWPPWQTSQSHLPPLWQTQLESLIHDRDDGPATTGKRTRVTLACQRCKTRKQKCNGSQPCDKCAANSMECHYVVPQKPMPFGKNQYIKSLERRVAELETILASRGLAEPSSDHWKTTAPTDLFQAGHAASEQVSHKSVSDDLDDPEEAILDWQDGVDTVVSVLRSLSLDVNGSGYIGASSHVALGRLFAFLNRERTTTSPSGRRRSQHQHTMDAQIRPRPPPTPPHEPIDFSDVPDNVAERLFSGYLKHIATRHPVIHSVWGREIHQRRHGLTDVFETAMLHLIYATAGRFLETTGESGVFQVKRHYAAATQSLEVLLAYNDCRTIQALMLMAIYCLREPGGPGAWTFSRMALLLAIEHGLHRQTRALSQLKMESELRKRLFWACYSFDRQISVPMGRPFGISDRDIDLAMPLDISEDTTEEQLLTRDLSLPQGPTSMTSFILVTRLRQIESEIQQTIYRVDCDQTTDDSIVDQFLERLDAWKATIPESSRRFRDTGDDPFDGYDYYLIFYYKCRRLLLYPQLSKAQVNSRYLKECAVACAGVCRAYKRLHQNLAVGYSFMALQTVFIAGLTLIYCIWLSPDEIFDLATSNGIHDCSIVLFVIAERVQAAAKYRNAFEVMRQQVIDQIAAAPEGRRPREVVHGLTAELATTAQAFEVNMPYEVNDGNFEQFSQIVTHMAGEDFAEGMNLFAAPPVGGDALQYI